ncbi:MAG: chemotaxis protein CheB [Byssovorax sp.]
MSGEPDAASAIAPSHRQADPGGMMYVVGIGASAGGLEALEAFFEHAPIDAGLAYVVVQHLSPDYKSMMVELLSKCTRMPVQRADDGMVVEPDHVYLIPPKKNLEIQRGQLRLTDKIQLAAPNLPIDIFFRSLAAERGERAIGVVLSGTGSDGMRGLRAIHEVGGLTLAQEPGSARFDGMPRSALATGVIDYVSAPEAMPAQLERFVSMRASGTPIPPPETVTPAEGLGAVLATVQRASGVDFSGYKIGTIFRRTERRMRVAQAAGLREYLAILNASPREVSALFKDLLIGVTKFFRDPESFEQLAAQVVAPLVAAAGPHETIRVWVPGCSTGEEAFSLAMLFHEQSEALGRGLDLKIFATDVDRDAIERASAGVYPESIAGDVSPERLARFFVSQRDGYHVSRVIRQSVIFAQHNIVKNAPFSRLDLVSCRNLLIYFDTALQRRALSLIHFALKPDGFAFLGSSESIADLPEHFRVVEPRAKIFQRTGALRAPSLELEGREVGRARLAGGPVEVAEGLDAGKPSTLVVERALLDMVEEFGPPSLLVSESLQLLHVFGDASRYLAVPRGTASFNVLEMLPKPLASIVALGTPKALREGRPISYRGISAQLADGPRILGLRIKPLGVPALRKSYVLVQIETSERRGAAHEATAGDLLSDQGARLNELQSELQFTQENLQATIEELETSNEELQATNEELVASNEEMQSTNEELQSVNEELVTVNAEYQAKIAELSELNTDVENLLQGASIATVFLDRDLKVRRFTPDAAGVTNLMARDIGRPIEHIRFNFDDHGLVEQLRAVSAGKSLHERTASTPDGRHFLIRMLPYMSNGVAEAGVVITFIDVTQAHDAEWQHRRVFDSLPEEVVVLDARGVIVVANRAWRRFSEENLAEPGRVGVGADYLAECRRASKESSSASVVLHALEALLAGNVEHFCHEYACHSPTEMRWFMLTGARLPSGGGAVLSHVNVTQYRLDSAGPRSPPAKAARSEVKP